VNANLFEHTMGIVLLLHAVCIGVQTEIEYREQVCSCTEVPLWLQIMEYVFLASYVVELFLRLVAHGFIQFKDTWFIFDLILVVLGVGSFILAPLMAGNDSMIEQFLVLRMMRILRLVRTFRMLPVFRVAWKLVSGFISASNTMLSTLALITMLLYMYACLGLELISKDLALNLDELGVAEHFSSIWMIMLTLVRFVTLDSLADIYTPLIREKPLLIIYFGSLLLIVPISLMNLVTAVIVEAAMEHARQDKDYRRNLQVQRVKELTPKLKDFFRMIDVNGSGEIEMMEIEHLVRSDTIPTEVREVLKLDTFVELMETLDDDGSGTIDEDEFVDGLLNLCLAELNQVPTESVMILKLLRHMRRSSYEREQWYPSIDQRFDALQDILSKPILTRL